MGSKGKKIRLAAIIFSLIWLFAWLLAGFVTEVYKTGLPNSISSFWKMLFNPDYSELILLGFVFALVGFLIALKWGTIGGIIIILEGIGEVIGPLMNYFNNEPLYPVLSNLHLAVLSTIVGVLFIVSSQKSKIGKSSVGHA
jgi:ABC-type phosphate/phosphonate transport system permease subunit